MGQKLSIFVRRGPSNIKTKSFDESELKATNIDEAPHPNETLPLRIKRFGPTNVVLVIRTNITTDDLVPLSNASPSHSSSSSSVYLRIHAHREVLCMRSKYFYSMLQGPNRSRFRTGKANCEEILDDELEFCDQNDDEIDLISIYRKTPSEMADMVGQVLHFLYFDERALNPDNVQTLLEAANYFQVEDLQHQCCRYIKDRIDRKNVIEIYLMALVYGTYELQRAAETFVMEHYESITSNKVTMKMFVQFLSKDELVKFISSDKLIVSSEGVVYKSIIKWIQHEPATRAIHLPQLLTHVDLPSILRDEVEDCHRISLQVKRNKNYLCIPPATISLEDSLMNTSKKKIVNASSENVVSPQPKYSFDTACDKLSSELKNDDSSPNHVHSVSAALENVMNEAKDYLRMDTNTKIDYWTKPGRSKPARWPKVLVVMRMYWKNLPMEWYDFRTRSWETLSDVQNWRSCTAMVGHRSTIFLLGGEESDPNSPTGSRTVNRVTKYDCEHKQWSTGPSMLLARRWAGAIVVDDSIYVIGGIGGKGGTYEKRLDSMEKLKISNLGDSNSRNTNSSSLGLHKNEKLSHKWVNLSPMSTSRSSHTVEYMNGKIYVVGGGDGKEWLCSAECYDIKSNKWSPIANLNAKRWKCGLVEVGDMLYAIGGMDSPRAGCWGSPLKTVERYSPTENKWMEVASMNEPRFGCSVVAYQGKIYASGGFGVSKSILQTMECFDPSTNKWTKMPQMKKMCGFVGGTLIDRPIHLDSCDSKIVSSLFQS